MLVGDGAAGVGGGRRALVVLGNRILSHGVLDGVARRIVLGQARPRVGPVVAALGDRGRGGRGAGGKAVENQREAGRADAVLVVRVVPDLRDRDVDKRVVVGIGHRVLGVGRLDRTRGGAIATEGGVGALTGDRKLGALEDEACRKGSLGEGVGRTRGEVVDADVVAGLHVDDDVGATRSVVPAVLAVLGGGARDHRVIDGIAVLVPDREPDPVVGLVLRVVLRLALGGARVHHVQGERELGVRRGVRVLDDLGQVQAGAAIVGGGEACGACLALVVLGPVDRVRLRTVGHGVLLVDLDEHGQHAIDHHRVYDRDVELPVIGEVRGLGEGEVVAGSQDLLGTTCEGAHDADGDEDAVRPAVAAVENHVVGLGAVARHLERDRLGGLLVGVELVLPLLGDGELFDGLVGNRIRVVVGHRSGLAGTGVGVGERGGGVGLELAVHGDVLVLANHAVEVTPGAVFTGVVLDVSHGVERELAGIDVEGHGVGDAVEQRADAREVPVNRAVHELCCRRIVVVEFVGRGPLVLELAAGERAVDVDGVAAAASVRPRDRLAVGADGVLDGVAVAVDARELVVDHGDGDPVLVLLDDLEKLGDVTGTGRHLVGGAVGDGDRGDAHGLDDLVEDLVDRGLELGRLACVEVVGGVLRRRHDVVDAAAAVLVVLGVVHEVVEQVGLGAVGVDAVEGAVSGLAGIGDCVGLARRGVVAVAQLADAGAGRGDGVVAVAGRGRCAVGDHDDEDRVVVADAVHERLGPLQRALPVGAVAVVGEAGPPVRAAVVEAVGEPRDVRGPPLDLAAGHGEVHERHADVVLR